MAAKIITMLPERIAVLVDDIRSYPTCYVGWTMRHSLAGTSLISPRLTILDRSCFPRGARDLGWLSRVRSRIKPLCDMSTRDLGVPVVKEMPRQSIEVSVLRSFHGRYVMYIDLVSAYWTALARIWMYVFGEPIPISAAGVPKQVRNAAWGMLGSAVTIEKVDPPGVIVSFVKRKEPPPLFYAVPWLISHVIRDATHGERCISWVDSVVAEETVGKRILSRLLARGWECHVIEGRAYVNGALIIADENGEVLKTQKWPDL